MKRMQGAEPGDIIFSPKMLTTSNNGAIYNKASIIKSVMSSTAEAKIGLLYTNARKGVEIQNILEEMGHKQPPTPIQTDNLTAKGIINSRVQPKWMKVMDMRFHWLCDGGINQNQFRFYWHPGALQRGTYWTKHHSPTHHHNTRSEILTPDKVVLDLHERLQKMSNAPKQAHTEGTTTQNNELLCGKTGNKSSTARVC